MNASLARTCYVALAVSEFVISHPQIPECQDFKKCAAVPGEIVIH